MFLPSNITLKFGDSGDFVAELQRRLAMVRCFSEDQVNGFYDGGTVNGVMAFQGGHGLHADGVAGPETLRRLNGVIAGDTGGTADPKAEEEAKQARDAAQVQAFAIDQQQTPELAMWGAPAVAREEAPAAAPQPAFTPEPPPLAPVEHQPSIMPQLLQADLAAERRPLEPIAPTSSQDLTAMLLAATQHPQQAPQLPPEALRQEQKTAPSTEQVAALRPQAEPLQRPTAQVAEPPRENILQRAGRFANAMMQKLADYFEAKLPPSVLNEVREAGQIMARNGLREAPIPTGPDNVRAPEQIPTRGPEAQPQQVR